MPNSIFINPIAGDVSQPNVNLQVNSLKISPNGQIDLQLKQYVWDDATTAINGVLQIDNAGDNQLDQGFIRVRRSRGTNTAPTAVQTSDYLTAISAMGYGTSYGAHSDAAITFRANGIFSGTSHPTDILFGITKVNEVAKFDAMVLQPTSLTLPDNATNFGMGVTSPSFSIDLTRTGTPAYIAATCYGANAGNVPFLVARSARGTLAAATKLLSGDTILSINGRGYYSSAFPSSGNVVINFKAAEDHNDSSHLGTLITFETTKLATSTRAIRMQMDANETASETALLLSVAGAAVQRVSVGANDSGGAGFRALRVAN